MGSAGKPTEVKQPDLATYTSAYFMPEGGGVRFRAPVNGVTTSGSSNPRSELREMNADGSNASWGSNDGKTHTLVVEEAFTHLPNARTDGGIAGVVGAQIHDASNDISVFRLEGSKLYVTNGNDTHYKLVTDSYVLGTRYEAKFVVSGGVVKAYYNGTPVATISKAGTGWYFKAGAYTQANSSNSKPNDATNYGETRIYKVTVSHESGTKQPPVDTPPQPAATKTVMVIRHGEKPTDKNSHVLNSVGEERAERLSGLFRNPPAGLAKPDVLFASKGNTDSMRPLQTLQPLARDLHLSIDTHLDSENAISDTAKWLKAQNGVTLASLEHSAIPGVCKLFASVPSTWPDDRFDVVWVFTSTDGGKSWKFTQVPENVMPGDKTTPIK